VEESVEGIGKWTFTRREEEEEEEIREGCGFRSF
jgi:hypothetical protein